MKYYFYASVLLLISCSNIVIEKKKLKRIYSEVCVRDFYLSVNRDSIFFLENTKLPVERQFSYILKVCKVNKDSVRKISQSEYYGADKYRSLLSRVDKGKQKGFHFNKTIFSYDTFSTGEDFKKLLPIKVQGVYKFKRLGNLLVYLFKETGNPNWKICYVNKSNDELIYCDLPEKSIEEPDFLLFDFSGNHSPELFIFTKALLPGRELIVVDIFSVFP